MPAAVEELLRRESPVTVVLRILTRQADHLPLVFEPAPREAKVASDRG